MHVTLRMVVGKVHYGLPVTTLTRQDSTLLDATHPLVISQGAQPTLAYLIWEEERGPEEVEVGGGGDPAFQLSILLTPPP